MVDRPQDLSKVRVCVSAICEVRLQGPVWSPGPGQSWIQARQGPDTREGKTPGPTGCVQDAVWTISQCQVYTYVLMSWRAMASYLSVEVREQRKEKLLRWKVNAAIQLQVIQWLSFEAEPLVLHQHCGTSSSLVLSNLMLLE